MDSYLLASPLQNSHYMKNSCRIYISNLVCKAVKSMDSGPPVQESINSGSQDARDDWD